MTQFVCGSCGEVAASWYGKCPSCGEWNTMKEFNDKNEKEKKHEKPVTFVPFQKLNALKDIRMSTGIYEFDRVLGGGVIKGEVILLAGEPGVGKSTLLLSSLQKKRVLYLSGEESSSQIRHRADRTSISMNTFYFSDSVEIEGFLTELEKMSSDFDIVVVDSIQTVYSAAVASPVGSQSQIRETAIRIIDFAKRTGVPIILVGHITKEGEIAGPKMLEHMVDCVLYFEGDRESQFRILRAFKNRFGSTDEVGVFEMRENGLIQIDAPTAFIDNISTSVPGKAIVGVVEGSRTLFYEVQCLCVPSSLAVSRRVASGFDFNKLQLILAVIRKNLKLPFDKYDVFVNVAGGVSIKSTAADLGIAASLISSIKNISVPKSSVFAGEVGLLGEIRKVTGEERIIKEAKRYGFTKIFSSKSITTISRLTSLF